MSNDIKYGKIDMDGQKDLEKLLRDTQRTLSSVRTDLRHYLKLKDGGAPFLLKGILESMERGFSSLLDNLNGLQAAFSQLVGYEKTYVGKKEQEFFYQFVTNLDNFLKEKGFALSGQLPNLKAGFYHLKVNWDSKKVQILFGPELLKTISLDPRAICQVVVDSYSALKRGLIPPEKFIDLLYRGYARALVLQGKQDGERLPIMTVLKEVVFLNQDEKFLSDPSKGNFKPITRLQFAIQLYELRKSNVLKWEGKDLHLMEAPFDATFKKQMFLWVPDNERGEGTRFSHILFK